MAMTYQDVLNQIKAAGMEDQFSQYDLATAQKYPEFGASMLSIKQDWNAATDQAGKTAANQAAEALRRQYGSYLGGVDGSKYYSLGPSPGSYQSPYQQQIQEALDKLGNYGSFEYGSAPAYESKYQEEMDRLLEQLKNYGKFEYGSAPVYENKYQQEISDLLNQLKNYGKFEYGEAPVYENQYKEQIEDLLNRVQNYEDFSWSKETDPAYSAYAKQYRREGARATEDAMAAAAAATGGQISTAAMTAAGQAGDYYAGQLADAIPQLYENAYQRYLSEYSKLVDQLGQTQQQEQLDYNKYLTDLGQFNTDRQMSYNQWLDAYNMIANQLGQTQQQEQMDYNKYLTDLGQFNTDRQLSYSQWLDEYNMLNNQMSQTQQLEQLAYNQYLTDLGQFNTDRQLSYDQWLNQYNMLDNYLGALQGQDSTEYNRLLDQVNFNQTQQNLYQAQVDAILQAGGVPSSALVGQSGYSDEYVQAMRNYMAAQQAAAAAGSSGGGSRGSGSSGGSGNSGGGTENNSANLAKDAVEWANQYGGDPEAYVKAHYKDYDYSNQSQALAVLAMYQAENAAKNPDQSPTVDLASVLALGYGPIGSDKLASLENQGVIESYEENGKIKFRKIGNTGNTSTGILGGLGIGGF